jgi:hypothetical protein
LSSDFSRAVNAAGTTICGSSESEMKCKSLARTPTMSYCTPSTRRVPRIASSLPPKRFCHMP